MNIEAFQQADIDEDINWLDKITMIMVLNKLIDNTTNNSIKFIIFTMNFCLLTFF